MTADPRKNQGFVAAGRRAALTRLILCVACLGSGGTALSQAVSTTTAGMTTRTLSLTFPQASSTGEGEGGSTTTAADKPEAISGLFLCERISSASSLNIEFGVAGCLQQGGLKTFMTILSVHMVLVYRPFKLLSNQTDDAALKLSVQEKQEFYLIGLGGFSKITSKQRPETNLSVATDTMDVGGGVGYSYRISRSIRLVGEANYLMGSVMSSAATGSSSAIQIGGGVAVML